MQKKMKVTLSLDKDIYNEFKKYCYDNAVMLSRKFEILMQEILEDSKKKKKEGK
jgi:hypothetical protein